MEACGSANEPVVVFPSEHVVVRAEKLAECIRDSEELSRKAIITFGVKPDRPNTGYGYIEPGRENGCGYYVKAFKEKPDEKTAASYISEGYLWNSGIFMFYSGLFMEEVQKHAPSIYNAFDGCKDANEVFSLIKEGISVDYGIMEKTNISTVVPIDVGWNDMGSFESFHEVFEGDGNRNIDRNGGIFIDACDNFVHTEKGKAVAVVGVDDLIIVDSRDALLVCKSAKAQKVREVVEVLNGIGHPCTEYPVSDYRPWGHYKVLEEEKGAFKIKRITVLPGKKLSLQVHRRRSEHWVVVSGKARATRDEKVQEVSQGESIFVRAGHKHRLENIGEIKLEIIEVQMGDYLEEDDIVRFEDDYKR